MPTTYLFTSESVAEGHPDKVADRISDAVLDAVLDVGPGSFVACETLVTTNSVILAGEIRYVPDNAGPVDYEAIARRTVAEIGYDRPELEFAADTVVFQDHIHLQSSDINQGVVTGGAGDQGMMFGYATDETDELMPAPITFAHRLTRRLADVRRSGELPWLRPDGKAQVTVRYVDERPAEITAVVLSAQHDEEVGIDELRDALERIVIRPVLPADLYDPERVALHINPTGRFVIGGPHGDAGLTGRKIIVDTYGGTGAHGGGAFSGKDPSKVDRSASYAARWVAKNIVAAGLARRVEVQLAYAIGVAEPVSVMLDAFGTSEHSDEELQAAVSDVFELTPDGITKALGLRRPIFERTANGGHFGRKPEQDGGFSWERLDRVDRLKAHFE
ncbi:MAG TPA: methionine adenosyltransferase [Gemmatimonadota bacterium]|nr:methionine adenosyltransferase [Gemmatimonadota bacterium]